MMKASQKKAKAANGSEGTLDDPMRTLGTLKLPEEDVSKFQEAIQVYGFEKSAIFLRRCAYALIKHHEAGEELTRPLAFKISHSPHPKHGGK